MQDVMPFQDIYYRRDLNGDYLLCNGDVVTERLPEVFMLIDRKTGRVVRHGSKEHCESLYDRTKNAAASAHLNGDEGVGELIARLHDDMALISGGFSVDSINTALLSEQIALTLYRNSMSEQSESHELERPEGRGVEPDSNAPEPATVTSPAAPVATPTKSSFGFSTPNRNRTLTPKASSEQSPTQTETSPAPALAQKKPDPTVANTEPPIKTAKKAVFSFGR